MALQISSLLSCSLYFIYLFLLSLPFPILRLFLPFTLPFIILLLLTLPLVFRCLL